ncbi:hypothetical protein J1N35_038997 [Gossypium stocksii]|uniref:Uncharacterized protein n=1 Tax=Gossypium stocksii TaxID=47602 RepID=A0A9D3ZN71_9ROSI|nr:hypothetical protein J1N35_038997 [Gossypium stocksii]
MHILLTLGIPFYMEYRKEKKEKDKAHACLKQIARIQGKKPPPNPSLVQSRRDKRWRESLSENFSPVQRYGKLLKKLKRSGELRGSMEQSVVAFEMTCFR